MKIYQVDAFAGALFQGNPAAVVPLTEWLPDAMMQNIAMENNLAETAFIVPGAGGSAGMGTAGTGGGPAKKGAAGMVRPTRADTERRGAAGTGAAGTDAVGRGTVGSSGGGESASEGDAYDYMIRWFTPTVEVELCGHATLASGQVVFQHLGYKGDVVVFRSLHSGDLKVWKRAESLELDFPMDMPELAGAGVEASVDKADHAAIFGGLKIAPRELYRGRHDYMVVLDSQKQIETLRPDFKILAGARSRGVVVTARGKDVDFVSRCFFPQSGIDEDPVTGSAYTMMIPFWAGRLGKNKLSAIQLSRRRGYLDCTLAGDRVFIGGQAQTYLVGDIFVG